MSFLFNIFLLFGALIPVLYPSFILNWIIISLFLSLFVRRVMISWLFEAYHYFVVSFCLFSFFLIVLFLFHNFKIGVLVLGFYLGSGSLSEGVFF